MAAALKCCFSFRTNEQTDKRGNGLERLLVEYGMKHCGVKSVTVNEQNPEAKGFYEHMGFCVYKRTDCDEQGAPYPLLYMEISQR
ncbi:GNAT family N-acetyltransferase [Flavonifractor plautii]|uniref:GNAT family N-acetyltransferase n=1 Tax=Flavonifractor plautii TaxID=292800 RepID=UPI0027D2044B|nr:GNAT family N-acetyltransferase [Flavonifractor plautii]